MKCVTFGNDNAGPDPSATNYRQLNTSLVGAWTPSETILQVPVSEDITVTGFYLYIGTAPGSSKSWDFYIRQNASNTSATINITGSATSGSWTGTVSLSAGDLTNLSCVPTSTPASAGNISWYIYYETVGKSFIMQGGSYQTTATTGTHPRDANPPLTACLGCVLE